MWFTLWFIDIAYHNNVVHITYTILPSLLSSLSLLPFFSPSTPPPLLLLNCLSFPSPLLPLSSVPFHLSFSPFSPPLLLTAHRPGVPLYANETIVEQPVNLSTLTPRYNVSCPTEHSQSDSQMLEQEICM